MAQGKGVGEGTCPGRQGRWVVAGSPGPAGRLLRSWLPKLAPVCTTKLGATEGSVFSATKSPSCSQAGAAWILTAALHLQGQGVKPSLHSPQCPFPPGLGSTNKWQGACLAPQLGQASLGPSLHPAPCPCPHCLWSRQAISCLWGSFLAAGTSTQEGGPRRLPAVWAEGL